MSSMARTRRTTSYELAQQYRVQENVAKHGNVARTVTTIGRVLIIAACAFGIVWVVMYYLLQISQQLAGTSTTADFALSVLADFRLSAAVSWAVGAGGAAYGVVERRLRKRNIARMSDRIQYLEAQLNTSRGSSNIETDGTTRKGDVW